MPKPFRFPSLGVAAAMSVLTLVTTGIAPLSASVTARNAKPLVVVFAPQYPAARRAAPGKTVVPAKPAADDEELIAMRAVRELLQNSRLVEAIAYYPDAPMFARAQAENKIRLVDPLRLTPDERLALARAVGAQHLIVANFVRGGSGGENGAASPEPAAGGIAIELQSMDTATRAPWSVRQRVSLNAAAPNTGFNAAGAAAAAYSPETLSAANSVVQKFLLGPLGNYTRQAPLPPDTSAPIAAAAPGGSSDAASADAADPLLPRDVAADAEAARRKGIALLDANNVPAALASLRDAINLQPRSAPFRAALVRAYLKAGRPSDATDEARRALALVPAADSLGQTELSRLFAQSLTTNGDTTAARGAYEQIIAARPQNSLWARIALADLLIAEKKPAEAEAQLREARKADPASIEAAVRLARLRAETGDMAGALAELDTSTGLPASARQTAARNLFAGAAQDLIASLLRARKEFDEGRLPRETFYNDVNQKAVRATALIKLLEGAGTAPQGETPAVRLAYRQRVLAGNQIAQAAASLAAYLETGDTTAGGRATLFLSEARQNLADAEPRAAAAPKQSAP